MPKRLSLLVAVFIVTLTARSAAAAVCVQIDTAQDTLNAGDRNSALILLAQTLREQGLQVSNQGCTETFLVSHVRFGDSVTVTIQGPRGSRQATARSMNDVPALYSQMVRSLLTNAPMNGYNGTVDRTNVTAAQQAPARIEADSLWYLRLGYGGAAGAITNAGPAIGFGYRYELDALGIDLSFLNLIIAGNNNDATTTSTSGITGSWVKLMGLYYLRPTANTSFYLGGGLGWGVTEISNSDAIFTGNGLQAELAAGLELLRASTIRIFAEADGTLPFYTAHPDLAVYGTTTGLSNSYVPSFSISLGLGWGRSIHRVQIVQ